MSVFGRVSGVGKYRAIGVWNRIVRRLMVLTVAVTVPSVTAVTFEWDHSPDPLVTSYRLYWGSASGAYDSSITVGYTNAATVESLPRAQTFYFTVTAMNAAGIESLPTNEVEYTTPANRPPLAIAQRLSLAEDSQVTVALSATDPDGDAVRYSISRLPAKGTLTGTPPSLLYKPAANYNGPDSFEFTATDGRETSTPVAVSLSVLAVNDLPVASPVTVKTTSGASTVIPLAGVDPDGDVLTFAVIQPPSRGTLSGIAPNLTYTASGGLSGTDWFTYVVRDGKSTSAAVTVTVTVAPPINMPVGYSQTYYAKEDQPLAITLSGRDPTGAPVTFSVVTQPNLGTLSGVSPRLTYTPNPQTSGIDFFTFVVSNGTLISAPVIVGIWIVAVNDPPVAITQNLGVTAGKSLAIALSGTDVDSPVSYLKYAVKTSPLRGVLTGTPPKLTYQPRSGFVGTDSFQFTVNDGSLTSTPGTVQVTVIPAVGAGLAGGPDSSPAPADIHDPASGSPTLLVVAPDAAVRATLTPHVGTTPDAQVPAPTLAQAPSHGLVQVEEGGGFTYSPADPEAIEDHFVLSTGQDIQSIGISFLRLTPDSDEWGAPFWALETVPGARYWVQVNREGNQEGSTAPANWEPYSWGIEGLSGTVRIPVDPEIANAQFRVVSEQLGSVQVTAPVELP